MLYEGPTTLGMVLNNGFLEFRIIALPLGQTDANGRQVQVLLGIAADPEVAIWITRMGSVDKLIRQISEIVSDKNGSMMEKGQKAYTIVAQLLEVHSQLAPAADALRKKGEEAIAKLDEKKSEIVVPKPILAVVGSVKK